MAYNIGELKENARYTVSTIDKWDGTTKTEEMTGENLKNFTNACAHLYEIYAEEVTEEPAEPAQKDDTAAALVERMTAKVKERTPRSAWDKGVKEYALELLEDLQELVNGSYETLETLTDRKAVKKAILNGADSWYKYSWGGCSLIYDTDIAERLCTPSELKRNRHGELNPNSRESWLDTQARALIQAGWMVQEAFLSVRWYDGNGEPLPRV